MISSTGTALSGRHKTGAISLKKIIRAVLSLVAAASVGMAGCSLPNSSQNTSLQVDDTGAVTETIIDTKDGDYTEDELASYIRDSIASYDTGEDSAVSLDSCRINGSAVKIVMKYKTVQDYSSYNSVPCFLGTLQEAEDAGYDINQTWITASGSAAGEDDLSQISARKKEWKVFIVSEPVYVRVPDKILYTTENVTTTGRLTANVDTVMSADITNPDAVTGTSSGTESVSGSSAANASSDSTSVSSSSAGNSDSTAMYSVTAVPSASSTADTASESAAGTSSPDTGADSSASGTASVTASSGSSSSSVKSSSAAPANANSDNEKYVTVSNEYAYIIYK